MSESDSVEDMGKRGENEKSEVDRSVHAEKMGPLQLPGSRCKGFHISYSPRSCFKGESPSQFEVEFNFFGSLGGVSG